MLYGLSGNLVGNFRHLDTKLKAFRANSLLEFRNSHKHTPWYLALEHLRYSLALIENQFLAPELAGNIHSGEGCGLAAEPA